MPSFFFGSPEPTNEMLEGEKIALRDDNALYLECMNNKPLSERKTQQEKKDGAILYWQCYKTIKKLQESEKTPATKKKKSKKA